MLIPKQLTFSGIGRFVTKQTVYFDTMGNLIQFDGDNRNTGGSSGSGKTTVFNAMDYNLGFNDLPTTVLQSRLTRDGIYTEGVYDWDGKEVTLIRGKGKLSVSVDGAQVEGSSKKTEEKIDEILGMSRDLSRKILHKRQKEGGFFLELGPSDTHKFLTDVLNLKDEAKKVEKVEKDIKDLTEKRKSAEIELKESRSALAASQEAILALGLAPVRDMHQSVVLDLKSKADASSTRLQKLTADSESQMKLFNEQRPVPVSAPILPSPVLDNTPFDRTAWDAAYAAQKAANETMLAIVDAENKRQSAVDKTIQLTKVEISVISHKLKVAETAKTNAQRLALEIKSIRECICPTCQQSWVAEAAKVREEQLLAELSVCKTAISEGLQAEKTISELNAKIADLTKQLEPYTDPQLFVLNTEKAKYDVIIAEEKKKSEVHAANQTAENAKIMSAYNAENSRVQGEVNAKNKAASDDFAARQLALMQVHSLELDQARGQADVDRRAFDAAVNKLKAFEEANARYATTLANLKKQEEQYTAKADEKSKLLSELETKLAIAEEVKRAIKSFMSCSFDEALEEIGDSATRIIRAIPNMANATIQFQGTRETQDGKIREEVTAVVSMDGEEAIDIRSLSGGERSSADLAIDLAVIDLIETRSNKGFSVFILDEPFTGLDTVSIEMVLEVLKNANINKKLIIVDHNPEVKQMVDTRVVAVREGLTSTIVQ